MNCILCPELKKCEEAIKERRAAVLEAAQGEQPARITEVLNDALQYADEFLTGPSQFKFDLVQISSDYFFNC